MGLPRTFIKLIAEIIREKGLSGRVLVIGKQDVYGTEFQVKRWLLESGVIPSMCSVVINSKPDFGRRGFLDDISLFKLMGFSQVDSLDYSDFEGANLICDLNKPLGDEWKHLIGAYDCVVDSGCTEHIFNVPQVFKNLGQFTKIGGVLIHILPTANYVDHGFYSFSPTIFCDYYGANQWKILHLYLIRHRAFSEFGTRDVFLYTPLALQSVSVGGFDSRLYLSFAAVQKEAGSGSDAVVQQGYYRSTWNTAASGDNSSTKTIDLYTSLRTIVQNWPAFIVKLALQFRAVYFRTRGVSSVLKFYKSL